MDEERIKNLKNNRHKYSRFSACDIGSQHVEITKISPVSNEPVIICKESSDNLLRKINTMENNLKALFPDQRLMRFDVGELLNYEGEPGDYILNLLSKTEHYDVILISGLEKLVLSVEAQRLFLKLYCSWHVVGKIMQITTTVPLEAGLGWDKNLLSKMRGAIVVDE